MNDDTRVVHRLARESTQSPEFMIFCPGCKCGHWFKTDGGSPSWQFNGDMHRPTINPSLLVRHSANGQAVVCHSFIRDGQMQFLDDCTHELKSTTVSLQPF